MIPTGTAPGGSCSTGGGTEPHALLEITDAHKRYGARPALAGVDLRLRSGEIYALLGPNGAGKTTLIRAICGRVALDAGSVRLAGCDPSADLGSRRRLGLAPQQIALYPELSLRENLELFARLAGMGRGEVSPAVDRALDWTGLAARGRERVGSLSGGMQRRLNLAAGTLHDPQVLLLDEPTVGVDLQAREGIHDLLRQLRARGMTILLTTHDLPQAESLADRIGILVEGRLRGEGSLEDLVDRCFGSGKRLELRLSKRPGAADAKRLAEAGLEAEGSGLLWTGRVTGGIGRLAEIGGRLSGQGAAIQEMRLQEPGLRGVFLRLTGKEFEE